MESCSHAQVVLSSFSLRPPLLGFASTFEYPHTERTHSSFLRSPCTHSSLTKSLFPAHSESGSKSRARSAAELLDEDVVLVSIPSPDGEDRMS